MYFEVFLRLGFNLELNLTVCRRTSYGQLNGICALTHI